MWFAKITLLSMLVCCSGIHSAYATNTIDPSVLPFDPLPTEILRAQPRKTFARWHVEPISLDNKEPSIDSYSRNLMSPGGYNGQFAAVGGMARQRPLPREPIAASDWKVVDMMTEVQRAIGLGLDGFAFSIYQLPPKDGWQKLLDMLEATKRVDGNFRVMLYLDDASLNKAHPPAEQLADALASVASHPSLFRADDGRLVVTAGGAHLFGYDYYVDLIAAMNARGVPIYFVAFEHQWTELEDYASIASGYGRYGASNPTSAARYSTSPDIAHAEGKTYMGSMIPQLFRPMRGWYVEARNSETLRATWKVAIDSKPDWLLLMNWNDYAEGNQVSPATGTQWAFYDLCAFYNTWYKMGAKPKIKRDVIYYTHRIQSTMTMPDPTKQTQLIVPREDNPAGHRNLIELLAFLTKPATLEIAIGGKTLQKDVPAGITSFKVPLAKGTPSFRVLRDGETVAQVTSAFEIRDRIEYQDLLYRAGSSTRPAVDMVSNPPLLP